LQQFQGQMVKSQA